MQKPIAYQMLPGSSPESQNVRLQPISPDIQNGRKNKPAIVVVNKTITLPEMETGIIYEGDIISVVDGDWNNAILVVAPPALRAASSDDELTAGAMAQSGDELFIASIPKDDTNLLDVGKFLLKKIRKSGVKGDLLQKSKGRWVNSPVNSFTLKIQPQKRNFLFTLYGNPETYEHKGFLRQDQNSYSRGWVKSRGEAEQFLRFAIEAHRRRTA